MADERPGWSLAARAGDATGGPMRHVGATALALAALTVVGVATATSASSQAEAPSVRQPTDTTTAQPGRPVPPVPDALPKSEWDRDRSRDCLGIPPDGEGGLGSESSDCEQLPWWWDASIEPLEPYRGTARLELLVDPASR